MADVVVGVTALVVGLLLCLRGYVAMRLLLAVWGAFVGFGLGATLVADLADEPYLAGAIGWLAALVLAVGFAALAYLFYAVAVVLAFGSMGYVLGRTIAAVLGVLDPTVLTVVGIAAGVLLGLLAVVTNLPELVLVVVSAFAGASVAITGVMILLDVLDAGELTQVALVERPAWYVAQLVLAVVGLVVQLRHARRRRPATVRQSWAAPA